MKSGADGSPAAGCSRSQSAVACATAGRTGTRRSLLPLPVTRRGRPGFGGVGDGQREGLGDAQAAAVEQGEEGDVAGLGKLGFGGVGDSGGERAGVGGRQGFGEGRRHFGRAEQGGGRVVDAVAAGEEAEEAADGGEVAGAGAVASAGIGFGGEPGAEVGFAQGGQRGEGGGGAEVGGEEGGEEADVAGVGLDGEGGGPAFGGEVGEEGGGGFVGGHGATRNVPADAPKWVWALISLLASSVFGCP